MPGLKVLNVRISTNQLEDQAVTNAKLADNAVTSPKIADGSIATADLGDSIITSEKISDKAFQAGLALCDSVETWIEFTTPFDTTPFVVATPAVSASWVRITQRTAGSFACIADVAGSIIWMAWVR